MFKWFWAIFSLGAPEEGTSAGKKVTLRDANEDVDKVCIEVQKTSDNAAGKPTSCFTLHSTQNF